LTGLDVPDAEGVPLGWQSRPQPEVDDDAVDVVLKTAAPPLAEADVVVVELVDALVGAALLDVVVAEVELVCVDVA
jgi:hypothetical protein